MDVTFSIVLDSLQPHRLNTSEGGEIAVNLVVFIWELDVVLCDVYHLKIKSGHLKFIDDME